MFDKAANCTDAPESTPSNAGIAGAGVILSFVITAALAIILSTSIIWSERRKKYPAIRRKLLSSYSDQQIFTGIGIQSVALATMDTLVPYHFFLIWMISLLSTAVHIVTLLALVQDFRRDWVLRWLRGVLMLVNLVLSSTVGVFVLRSVQKGRTDSTLPIACVNELANADDVKNVGVSYFGTIVVIAVNFIVFILATWYLHDRRQRFYQTVQIVGVIVMTASATAAVVRMMMASQAFGTPSVNLADKGETEWSFGQLLSILVLIFPLVSVIEIARGEMKVPACEAEGDELPLKGYSGQVEFQPSPFVRRRGG